MTRIAVVLLAALALSAPAQQKKASTFNKTLGVPNAPIAIEVYSDFECPHCRDLYVNTLRRVISEYVQSNKVFLIHHDFPLPQHQYARDAARWATAASACGQYETVTGVLFENQAQWSADGKIELVVAKAVSPEDLKKIKQVLEQESAQVDASVERDLQQGRTGQVSQTPTMFIKSKGKVYPQAGVVQFEVFKAFLDQLLEQK